jgi:hypothetical protein
MHSPGQIVEFKDRHDVVRALRLPWECIAAQDGLLIEAMGYWRSLGQQGMIPEPRSVDPIMLKPLLGWTHKVDTSDPDPANYYFRLWGTNIPLERHKAFTGLRVSEYPSEPYRDAVMQDYRDVVATGVPTYQHVLARINYLEYSYTRLILPLATDRRNVNQLLVCIQLRPATTLSDRLTAGTWVSARSLSQGLHQTQSSGSSDRLQRFSVIVGGKAH